MNKLKQANMKRTFNADSKTNILSKWNDNNEGCMKRIWTFTPVPVISRHIHSFSHSAE